MIWQSPTAQRPPAYVRTSASALRGIALGAVAML
jgi:hypothetical protein